MHQTQPQTLTCDEVVCLREEKQIQKRADCHGLGVCISSQKAIFDEEGGVEDLPVKG
jgi:hypothetical protein